MLFNLPSTISENDIQFDVKTCDFVEKTDNIHASVGFIDHINIPAEIHLAIFAAL